jgi:hypothetical protein
MSKSLIQISLMVVWIDCFDTLPLFYDLTPHPHNTLEAV